MQRTAPQSSNGILSLVGRTPRVELTRSYELTDGRLHAKLEAFYPGGSEKDRLARVMFETAMAAGLGPPESTIIESTSGNLSWPRSIRYLLWDNISYLDEIDVSEGQATP